MPINQFKSAWKYYKLQQELSPLHAADILAIIEEDAMEKPHSKQLFLLQMSIFLLLILCCQGG
ncbi:MAG: hypothetical protein AAFO82_09535 [Bacteroidota bacterium]